MYRKLIFGLISVFLLTLVGCGGNSSILLDEYYSAINWRNNKEEIGLLVSKLDDKRFEITKDDSKITVIDKEIKTMDKLEYQFEDDMLVSVKFRSNSKEVSCISLDTVIFYYINDSGQYVTGIETQKTYLKGQKFFEEELDTRNKEMLLIYSNLEESNLIHQTRSYFKELVDIYSKYEIIDYEMNEKKEPIISLIDTTDNSKIVVRYDTKAEGFLPIESIKYFDKSGKVIEMVIKNSELVAFKNYITESSTPTEVSTFKEQGAFLLNK